jgi:hypothetical protein
VYDNGDFTRIDVPGATETTANGINDPATIVGAYVDDACVNHAYRLERGRLTTIDSPFSASVNTADESPTVATWSEAISLRLTPRRDDQPG